jgi:hypothetical protein
VNLDRLVARAEALHEELGRESYLTGAGLKTEPAFQAIYTRHADLLTESALETARASGSAPLLEWAVDVRVGRAVAPFEERQLVWESRAQVEAGGRAIPYLRVPIELANVSDRALRLELDRARGLQVTAGLNQIRCARFVRERDVVLALGLGDYPASIAALSGIALDALAADAQWFLAATEDLYRDNLRVLVRHRLSVPLDDLVRADAGWLFRADRFDDAFPPGRLVETAAAQMRELGLDHEQEGRVRFDTAERPAKQPRAFCAPVRIPHEVYLVLRPRGGHNDYRTFWHELGHAMHFAATDPALPFAARWLGDNSVTEGFAMLYDHFTLAVPWLQRFGSLDLGRARELAFELGVSELFLIRRYAAKLLYELELHRGDYGPETGAGYVERLSAATLFRYLADDHLIDVDPAFYAARYLRAWQMEAVLARALTERLDTEWYRRPEAGELILDLMRRGQSAPADRLVAETMGAGLTFAPVLDRLAAILE